MNKVSTKLDSETKLVRAEVKEINQKLDSLETKLVKAEVKDVEEVNILDSETKLVRVELIEVNQKV